MAHLIQLFIDKEEKKEWDTIRRTLKKRGLALQPLLAKFVIDKLSEDMKNDFSELKKYI